MADEDPAMFERPSKRKTIRKTVKNYGPSCKIRKFYIWLLNKKLNRKTLEMKSAEDGLNRPLDGSPRFLCVQTF